MAKITNNLFKSNDDLNVPDKILTPIYMENSPVEFPPLHYYSVDEIKIPKNADLRMGGSYSIFWNLPHHRARCLMLEELICPYTLDGPYLKTRYSTLLWQNINRNAYTNLLNPQSVFIETNGKFISKFVFLDDHIELYELRKSSNQTLEQPPSSSSSSLLVNKNNNNNNNAVVDVDEGMQVDYL